jgi:transposase-like protein
LGRNLQIAVGDSEAEGFGRLVLGSPNGRGLTGNRLVISDAHLGLTAAIKRMFQGCCWRRTERCAAYSNPPRGALGKTPIKRRTNVVGIFPNDAANGLRPTSSIPGWWAVSC